MYIKIYVDIIASVHKFYEWSPCPQYCELNFETLPVIDFYYSIKTNLVKVMLTRFFQLEAQSNRDGLYRATVS